MKALVTGGAGPIGSHVVEQLLARGDEVVVLDDLTRGRADNVPIHADLVLGDVRSQGLVDRLVDQADVVFHLAALNIRLAAEQPRYALEVMFDGAFNVIEAAAVHDVKVVASSSASVYGLANKFPITEDQPPRQNNTLYGAAKTAMEGMLRAFAHTHDLRYVALRYFNVYGPRMDAEGKYVEVFVRWMEAISNGRPVVIEGDGTTTLDLVYVADVARANLLAAQPEINDLIVNVGTGIETSLKEVAEMLMKEMGDDRIVMGSQPEFQPAREGDVMQRRQADTRKAKALLGFEAEVPLDEVGIALIVDWWLSR